jgi:putative transposase
MLFGQIPGQHGLRGIERGMNSRNNSLYHPGIPPGSKAVKRSTLPYADNKRSSGLFKDVFERLLAEAYKMKSPHGFRFKNPLDSIDAAVIDLRVKLFPRADFRTGKAGIKLAVKPGRQGKIPCFIAASNARQHDVQKVRDVPVARGDVVVFGRGYTDYEYFKALCRGKVWFVTRLKGNTKYKRVKKNPVKSGGVLVSDYEIIIPPLSKDIRLRKIIARGPETEKKITLLTNNLQRSPKTAGGIYKDRRQIELFFKAVQQNLKIKRFYGNSPNAVMAQVRIAVIAYLLFYLLKMQSKQAGLSCTIFIPVMSLRGAELSGILSGA